MRGQSVFLALCLLGPLACAGTETNRQALAERLFREVETRFANLQTLQYAVEKTTRLGPKSIREVWHFCYRAPEEIRVDYEKPQERQIILDSTNLWEYLPARRQAVHTDLARLNAEERQKIVASVFARLAIDGIRPGAFDEMVKRTVRVTPEAQAPSVFLVEGESPRFAARVDGERHLLLQSELYGRQGQLSLRTVASDFREVAPSFWYPLRLQVTGNTPDGYAVSDIVLRDVRVNESIPAGTFEFAPPRQIEVLENQTKR